MMPPPSIGAMLTGLPAWSREALRAIATCLSGSKLTGPMIPLRLVRQRSALVFALTTISMGGLLMFSPSAWAQSRCGGQQFRANAAIAKADRSFVFVIGL